MNSFIAPARLAALLVLGVSLAACGADSGLGTTSTRELLQVRTTNLPAAFQNEPYNAPISLTGGVNPYSVRVASGTLPPGVRLNGTTLSGTPTATGRFEFVLEVSDANLNTRTQALVINVATLPPLTLAPFFGATAVAAEFRAETRVPLRINYPRATRAARFQWRLPEGVQVTRVQPGAGAPLLLWKQSGTLLTLDLGFPTAPQSGTNVALIGLRFAGPTRLDASAVAFDARSADGAVVAQQPFPQAAPEAAPAEAPSENTAPQAPGEAPAGTPAAPQAPPSAPASPPAEQTPPPAETAPPANPGGGS